MKATVACVLLVALSASLASAARPVDEFGFGRFGDLKSSLQTYLFGRHHHHEKEDRPAYVAIRFVVPPSESDEFEDEWQRLDKADESAELFDLKKTKTDNLFYVSYGEWDSQREFYEDFLLSDAFKDFAEWVDDHGIKWELEPLLNFSEDVEKEEDARRESFRSYFSGKERDELAHVLIYYIVPPGQSEEFVDAWTDAAYETVKEDGNRIYSLRKVATDNTKYYAYGTWDSFQDYKEHFESDHIAKLREFFEDKDIIWFLSPLRKIGDEPEVRKTA